MLNRVGLILISTLIGMGCALMDKTPPPKSFIVQKKWARATLDKPHLGFRHNHRMQPIVTEDLVIQGNAIDGIVAYQRQSGHEVWRLNVDGGVEAGAVLEDGQLYFGGSDGFFYSLNYKDGQIRWTTPIRAEGLGRPLVQGNSVYFLAGSNVVYSLDRESGRQNWQHTRQDTASISIRGGSQPSVAGDMLYVGFSDGYLMAFKKDSGRVVWERPLNRNKRFKDVDAQPIIEGDRIYITSYDDAVYCLNRENGQLVWRIDEGGHSSVTLAPRRLFYASSTGNLVAADKRSGKVLWRYKLNDGIGTKPILYRGLVVFGESVGSFKALSMDEGQLVGQYDTGRGVSGQPYIDGKTGEAYFITVDADLYAMKLDWVPSTEVWPWQ